jgi:hypothetical protein
MWGVPVGYIYQLAPNIDHAFTWPELYGAIAISAFILFIGIAMFVALFANDDKRASRAHMIFCDLLKLFQRRTR